MLRVSASAVLVSFCLLHAMACGGASADEDRAGQADGTNIAAIAIGDASTCTMTARGDVQCDGRTVVQDGVAISAGRDHVCAVRRGGRVVCFGGNQYGQLGDGTTETRTEPVEVALEGAVGVTAGFNRTCAWTANGDAYCWGSMEFDPHAGTVNPRAATTPLKIDLVQVKSISLGAFHACALIENGSVQCWGANYFGQLGDGTDIAHDAPMPALVNGATQVSAGTHHTCAILLNGTVQCWGADLVGQLGEGAYDPGKHTGQPATIPGLRNAKSLIAASDHTCVLLEGRSAPRCWGYNDVGQVSPGKPYIVRPATIPTGIDDVVVIGSGANRTCAAREDGALKCWGS